MKKIILLTFIILTACISFAQKNQRDSGLVQFSGLLLSADSIFPIPFANIFVSKNPYGTYSNLDGYFSFVAKKGDTVVFTHVEFQKSYFIIPDTLHDFKYHIVKLMVQDTFYFPGVVVTPMPNRATFDHLFTTKIIPNDDLQRAKNNLEREELREQAMSLNSEDASIAYKNIANMYAQKSYYAGGQIPPMNIMNPFAWLQFFEAWKRGDYKKKSTNIKR
ncbi:MAG: carboxypeptidase-like regulatory domain-containing protein [Bacteroidota bacterium]|nr:carboxypeptidase-like regulatory domain-containing protein [Bacteroidota bacterium]